MSKSTIKLITLGGVRENGKNLYVAEVDDSIFVLDAGLKYPENEQLGVDVVIPNMDYLVMRMPSVHCPIFWQKLRYQSLVRS